MYLNHFAAHLKLTQYCELIILQLKCKKSLVYTNFKKKYYIEI